jgi:ADP-dependent NAD(P)H-hydrate dehydratase / NAD(P)H-hydrate epimerase
LGEYLIVPMLSLGSKRAQFVVTAAQMRAIEERMFASGMPVPALMEKVASRISQRVQQHYPHPSQTSFGILVGPGHNGGDALVVARELHCQGYRVQVYCPFSTLKPLTQDHANYVRSLGIPISTLDSLQSCDVLIDGLFGFGLARSLEGAIADSIDTMNQWHQPILSIDLPSGLHTDTGAVLGTAIRASHTFCLGLWKLGLLQEQALAWIGEVECLDFDIPLADIEAVLGSQPQYGRITSDMAIAHLPLMRPVDTHKYQMGHLLLIAGSQRYAGAALLAGLGAKASGVGMLTLAVPMSLKSTFISALPDALIYGCPETASGAIQLPDALLDEIQAQKYSAIACGSGLTMDAIDAVRALIPNPTAILLDADALNIVAQHHWLNQLAGRQAATVLTPHLGEFKRLFPHAEQVQINRAIAVQEVAQHVNSVVLLKGARTVVANANTLWINPESTPALARGGSGDVLSGLLGGLMAQAIAQERPITPELISAGVWWHSQAALYAEKHHTTLGVDALRLSECLTPVLALKT